MEQRNVEWQWWSTDQVQPYEGNARVHSTQQVEQIAKSIKEFGWRHPILVDGGGEIIAGHGRLLAAEFLGLEKVPVTVNVDLTPEKVRALRLADNRIAELSTWDEDLLKDELASLSSLDVDLSNIGWDDADLKRLFEGIGEDEDEDEGGGSYDGHQYTKKVQAPIYEPSGECPLLSELIDRTKTEALLAEIEAAGLPEDVSRFLRLAAERHTVFNFAAIANYYAHADAGTQDLMERSALVIIDFNKAIENGFVRLSQAVDAQFTKDYPELEDA